MVLFFCFSSRIPDLSTSFGQAQHPTHLSPTARSAAERARRPAVIRNREDFGEFRAGPRAPAPTPRTGTHARVRSRPSPSPASEVTSEAPPEQGQCLPRVSRSSPAVVRTASAAAPREAFGAHRSPPPRQPVRCRAAHRGWGGCGSAPSSGSALTCVTPRAQGGPGGRAATSEASGSRHRLSWRRCLRRPRDVASAPGRPQPWALCLGRRRRVTGLGAVSRADRGAGGTEPSSASPSSPAGARRQAGRTGTEGRARGGARRARQGGALLESESGAPPELREGHVRAVPGRGCSAGGRASGGCALEGAAARAASRVRVSPLLSLKVTAAPSG